MRVQKHTQKGLNTISTQNNALSLVRLVFSPVHTIITSIALSLLSIGYSSLNNDCSFLQTLTMTLIIICHPYKESFSDYTHSNNHIILTYWANSFLVQTIY